MNEKDLIYNLTQEIKKSTKTYQQSQELAHKDSLIVAENGFLEIWGRARMDYSNVKLSYFKGEITAEQFDELSRDIVMSVHAMVMNHSGAVRDIRQPIADWMQKIKKDVAKATGKQDEKE